MPAAPALALLAAGAGGGDDAWKLLASYPSHAVAQRLRAGERIAVDGDLSDEAWRAVPWARDPFVDIVRHNDSARDAVPAQFQARVKVRWDEGALYVAAELRDPFLYGSLAAGHNTGPAAPYVDDDFEVFVDVSGTAQYYKEYEMNILNATYDVLWGVPDGAGLQCDDSARSNASLAHLPVCVNTSFPGYAGSWTMAGAAGGLAAATGYPPADFGAFRYPSSAWAVEMAFPIRGAAGHGGLLDAGGLDFGQYDPNRGDAGPGRPRYWRVDFARAEHPRKYTARDGNATRICPFDCPAALGDGWAPSLAAPTQDDCAEVLARYPTLLGIYPWNCYWEWTWQALDPLPDPYMHRPMDWGVVQFAPPGGATLCRDAEHPARRVARLLFYAQARYRALRGAFAGSLAELRGNASYCAAPGCDAAELAYVAARRDVFAVAVRVTAAAPRLTAACTARPCYAATVTVTPPGAGGSITATVNENMRVTVEHAGAAGGCL